MVSIKDPELFGSLIGFVCLASAIGIYFNSNASKKYISHTNKLSSTNFSPSELYKNNSTDNIISKFKKTSQVSQILNDKGSGKAKKTKKSKR